MSRQSVLSMFLILALLWPLGARPARATDYTVTTTNDSGPGSLRQAIIDANTNPGPDTISFNIPTSDPGYDPGSGVWSIQPATPLPTLTGGGVTIDGYTQTGAITATASAPAVLKIEIKKLAAGTALNGLIITSANNVVRGLIINQFPQNGIAIGNAGATGNVIAGNYIGTDETGGYDEGNGYDGVFIGQGAQYNTVGGDTPAARNVLSGNNWDGVGIHGAATMSNTVSGNTIGTTADGSAPIPNGICGVRIYGGAKYNTIGGETAGARNVISGNKEDGVRITDAGTDHNTVLGNTIGLNAAGAAALSNLFDGVYIQNGARYNTIGGAGAGAGNVISGNVYDGVGIHGATTMSNTIAGNLIGLNVAGTAARPNLKYGVRVYGNTQGNVVGMDWEGNGARNVISGNGQHGVVLSGAGVMYNMVGFNYIGADATGLAPVGNTQFGVFVEDGAHNNAITGNVIAANDYGVWVEGVGTVQNVVDGNLVGLAADNATPLGNTADGIHISIGAQGNNTVANHIAHNGGDGVAVDTPTAFGNYIMFNEIHDNAGLGIHLTNGANNGIGAPLITGFDPVHRIVSGAACPGCVVDVYASSDNGGEGEDYLWWAVAGPAGDFAVTLPALPYTYLTATATGAADGTSEFSAVFTATIRVHLPLITKNF